MARLRGNRAPAKSLSRGNFLWQHLYSRMVKYTSIKEVNNSSSATTSAGTTATIGTSLPPPHNFHRRREKLHGRCNAKRLLLQWASNSSSHSPLPCTSFQPSLPPIAEISLARVLPQQQHLYSSYFRAAQMAISNGVVDASNITQHKYWRHWCEYVEHLRINPPPPNYRSQGSNIGHNRLHWQVPERVLQEWQTCHSSDTPSCAISHLQDKRSGRWRQSHLPMGQQIHYPNPTSNWGIQTQRPASHTQSLRPCRHHQYRLQNRKQEQQRSSRGI